MGETQKQIDRSVIPAEDLVWNPAFSCAYYVPEKCIGCAALSAKTVAEVSGSRYATSPQTDAVILIEFEAGAQIEMERRTVAASEGTCEFIEEQNCWRVSEVVSERGE